MHLVDLHPQSAYDLVVAEQRRAVAARAQENRAILNRRARGGVQPTRATPAPRRRTPRRAGRG